MSARDEFRPASVDGYCNHAVWGLMCDEIDRLRAELTAERTVRKQLAEAVVYDLSFDQTRVTELRAAALAASDALDKETTR